LFQSTADIYRVYWPHAPLPGVAKEDGLPQQQQQQQQQQQHDSGAGIEMMPLQTEPSPDVSVIINVDSAAQ
jgi:hypothetical protein